MCAKHTGPRGGGSGWWLLAGPHASVQFPLPPSIAIASSAFEGVGVMEGMPAPGRKHSMQGVEVLRRKSSYIALTMC